MKFAALEESVYNVIIKQHAGDAVPTANHTQFRLTDSACGGIGKKTFDKSGLDEGTISCHAFD